jgi:BACON domain-containing protein
VWSNFRHSLTMALTFAFGIGCYTSPQALALTATPTALNFQATQGGSNPSSQSVNVSKSNNKVTNWTASDSAAWISVSPGTGSISKAAQITVTVNTAGLSAGTYSATVAVTVYKGGSISIPVSLTVAPATASLLTATNGASILASLSWNPPPDTVAGYKVYVGTASGVYGPPINVGNVTSYVLNNLAPGTYYFVVTGYNGSGAESTPSNEVTKTIY